MPNRKCTRSPETQARRTEGALQHYHMLLATYHYYLKEYDPFDLDPCLNASYALSIIGIDDQKSDLSNVNGRKYIASKLKSKINSCTAVKKYSQPKV